MMITLLISGLVALTCQETNHTVGTILISRLVEHHKRDLHRRHMFSQPYYLRALRPSSSHSIG